MEEKKLQELNKDLSTLLAKYNCTLQVAHTIQVVPNKMEENTNIEAPVESTEETIAEVSQETPAEEVA